jgi:hypothetical protein
VRPIFHSEADFQHSLAWNIQLRHPDAAIRLETRPERGIRLDVLVDHAGERTAIELKYLSARFQGTVNGETFDLPNQAAQDISRHDFVKDVSRVERFVADGIADVGWAVALTNDGSYWRTGWKLDPVDAAFRINEGRTLEGSLGWGALAGAGTTAKRDKALALVGSYACNWHDYSSITLATGKAVVFRYLAIEAVVTG